MEKVLEREPRNHQRPQLTAGRHTQNPTPRHSKTSLLSIPTHTQLP